MNYSQVKPIFPILFSLVLLTGCSKAVDADLAKTPCDFKGISVGDKMEVKDIMKQLGVTDYKSNPRIRDWNGETYMENIAKYGLSSTAGEVEDFQVGPYCMEDYCRIPYGVKVGFDIPASIFISFNPETHQIRAVDVTINSSNWDDFVKIIKKKYGDNFSQEHGRLGTVDPKNKEAPNVVIQKVLTHKTGGINLKTKDTCEIGGTNYDGIFTHYDPLGRYHSTFEIKLISTNF